MGLDFISLLALKSLRKYNKRLFEKLITYYLLFIINIAEYKKNIYFILIISLNTYNIILRKSWINKYDVFLNIIKNKVLFILNRYYYEGNSISSLKNLIFLISPDFVLLNYNGLNVSRLIYIFKKALIDFFRPLKPIIKYSKSKNKIYNNIIEVLNIYEIAAPAILKYIREKIYKIFILTLI